MENALDLHRLLQKTINRSSGSVGEILQALILYAKKRTTTAGFVQWVLREDPLRLEEIP